MASFGVIADFRDRRRCPNPMGSAKIDCDTCSALHARCDRQRPHCGTCRSSRRKCGGFAMSLVWKDPTVPDKVPEPSRDVADVPSSPRTHGGQHEFRFVQGRPKRKHKPKTAPTRSRTASLLARRQTRPFVVTTLADFTSPELADTVSASPGYFDTDGQSSLRPYGEPGLFSEPIASDAAADQFWPGASPSSGPSSGLLPMPPYFYDSSLLDGISPISSQLAEHSYNSAIGEAGLASSPLSVSSTESHDALQAFILPIEEIRYQSLAQKYGQVLTMFDQEFCVIPLSSDCNANPFRVPELLEQNGFLLHAILAISSQHLAKKNNSPILAAEMQSHRSMAIQLFSSALLCQSSFPSLLDTIIMLIHLEVTQSAFGLWGVHLNGARKLLEEAKSIERHMGSFRTRSQIAMLVWWDVTVAFLSRRDPRIPKVYLEALVQFDEMDGWNFFTLSGCPAELVLAMARLARLASVYEKTTRMEWTIFNRYPVDVIAKEVSNFVNKENVALDAMEALGEDVDARRNRYHCIEAWRHAILLYICRVFTPEQDALGLRKIGHLARSVLEHARCIPRTEMVQKQLLLPIFVAASEVGDDWNRSFTRRYCEYWNSTSRFEHYGDTLTVLEGIWSDVNPLTKDVSWWGKKIGQDSPLVDGRKEQPIVVELLLG